MASGSSSEEWSSDNCQPHGGVMPLCLVGSSFGYHRSACRRSEDDPPHLMSPSTAAGRGSPREHIRMARCGWPPASSAAAACFVTTQPRVSATGTTVVSGLSPRDGRAHPFSWKAMKQVRRDRACWRCACMHTWRAQCPWASPEESLPPWA